MSASQMKIDQWVAQSEALMQPIMNDGEESSMGLSSGQDDPELMGYDEPRFTRERERLFNRLETIIRKQLFIKDRFGPPQCCTMEVQGSEGSTSGSECRS